MVHGTCAQMRRGTEATWQGRAWPMQGASGVNMWQEATQVHMVACEGRHVEEWGRQGEDPRVSGPR